MVSGGVFSVMDGRISRLAVTFWLCFLLLEATSMFSVAFLFLVWEDVVNDEPMLSADLVLTRSRHELHVSSHVVLEPVKKLHRAV